MDVLDGVPNDRLKQSVEELEFGSLQDRINHEMLQSIADNKDMIEILTKVCNTHNRYVKNLQSQIKLIDNIVSANGIALNNIEKDLYEKERFVFNEKSYKESNKEIKCYCGHTITCDCEPFDVVANEYIKSKIEEAEKSGFVEPETKQMDIADAVDLFEHFINEYPIDYKPHFNALETCIAWIKAELHDKNVSIKTQMKDGCVNYGTSEGYEDHPRTGGLSPEKNK